ncbi:hypothetical protein Tco_1084734, partial [Tanacetum coccineum]
RILELDVATGKALRKLVSSGTFKECVGIKRLLEVAAAKVIVTAAKHDLVFKETVIQPASVEDNAQRRAIENRFGGNTATKKTRRNLLKQRTNSSNAAVNTAHGATTASTQATLVNSTTIDSLSDAMTYGYANNEGKEILEKTGRKFFVNGLGYTDVPRLYTANFLPPKPDLVYPSLDDFVDESLSESVVKKPTVETNEPKTTRKENGAPIIKDWVSESEEEDESKFQTVKPNFTKIEFVKPKTNRKPVEQISQNTHSPRGNKKN